MINMLVLVSYTLNNLQKIHYRRLSWRIEQWTATKEELTVVADTSRRVELPET
jgi:hypothetical protein